LQCARAIAGAGFAAEAVYTARFGSLHGNTANLDDRVGLNFSQPGVVHSHTMPGDLTWRQIVALGNKAKKAKVKTPGKCRTPKCKITADARWRNGFCCGCYEKICIARRPAFVCAACGVEVAPSKESYLHRNKDNQVVGRKCKECYDHSPDAKPAFCCVVCKADVEPLAKRFKFLGGLECRKCHYQRTGVK
jgi:hypothetical protein